jgi:hypothetical protein
MIISVRDRAENEHVDNCTHQCTKSVAGAERYDHVHTCRVCMADADRRVYEIIRRDTRERAFAATAS